MCIAFQKVYSKKKYSPLFIQAITAHLLISSKKSWSYMLTLTACTTYYLRLFEIKVVYPQAYRMAVEYRKWLTREIFELIFSLEMSVLKPDADMVLNLIDGLMFEF